MRRQVVVIGGGVSGLATAFELAQRPHDLDFVVIEGRTDLGGNVRTLVVDDCIVDAGPDCMLTSRPEGLSLCRLLGLEEELTGPSREAGSILVAQGERLIPLPEGLVYGVPRKFGQIARTPLLTWRGRARAALDLVLPKGRLEDVSVGDLVGRRLGKEMKDRLIEPIVGGIFAGDIDRLDAKVATPLLAEAPRSLMASMLKVPRSELPPFRAPRRGMSRIVDALAERIGAGRIRRQTTAVALGRRGARWEVTLSNGEPLLADDVVVAAPPFAAARLLSGLDPDLGARLAEIRSLSTAAVVLIFENAVGLPTAGGMLVPRVERRVIIAATFASTKWPGRAPGDRTVVRAFLGGDRAPELLTSTSDAHLVALALADLGRYFPLPRVRAARVVRFDRASPVPEIGHTRRIADIRALAARWPGLHFAGGGYGTGVGFASCAAQAVEAANAVVRRCA